MTHDSVEIALRDDQSIRKCKELTSEIREILDSGFRFQDESAIYASKLLYMKRRFVVEQTFGILSKDPGRKSQLERFAEALTGTSSCGFVDKDMRILRLKTVILGQSVGQNYVQVMLERKQKVLAQMAKFYSNFFVANLAQLRQCLSRLRLLVERVRETHFGDQLITSYKGKITELLNYYLVFCESLKLKGMVLAGSILQTLYTDENLKILQDLRHELTNTVEGKRREIALKEDLLGRCLSLGPSFQSACRAIGERRVQIARIRVEVERLLEHQ